MPTIRRSYKDQVAFRNLNASIKRTVTKAKNMGVDIEFTTRNYMSFRTRDELNKYKRNAERFILNNQYYKNDRNVVFNRKHIREANRLIEKENRQKRKLAKKIGKLPQTIGGVRQPLTVERANKLVIDDKTNLFLPTKKVNIDSYSSTKQLDNRIKALKRKTRTPEKRYVNLRKNYIKALNTQRKEGNLTGNQYKRMVKDIKSMSISQFTTWFYQEGTSLDAFRYENLGVVSGSGDNIKSMELQQIRKSLRVFKNENKIKG